MKTRLTEYWYLKTPTNTVMYLVEYKALLSYISLIVHNYKINIPLSLCVILSYVIPHKNKINELAVIYDIVLITSNNADFNS